MNVEYFVFIQFVYSLHAYGRFKGPFSIVHRRRDIPYGIADFHNRLQNLIKNTGAMVYRLSIYSIHLNKLPSFLLPSHITL